MLQATAAPPAPQAPALPAPARPAPAPGATPVTGGAPFTVVGIPTTQFELRALRSRRSELSDQLISANRRRNEVSNQLRNATSPADRAGLETRLGTLDARIVQIEKDIDETGRQISSAPAALLSTGGSQTSLPPGALDSDQVTGIAITSIVLIGLPLAIAFARLIWRRGSKGAPVPASPELVARLDRMEQGVEAIAIEIERISEGQRFTTKLLSGGAADPIRQRQLEAERLPRGS